ncbi:MAG: hypothetical protein VX278_18530 [Myxococcota bacterium]|nr:hypothetical protein [Myxococcota bacterium]
MQADDAKFRIPYPKPGIQFWFWISEKEPKEGPPLLFSSMPKDPELKQLRSLIAMHPYGRSDRAFTGAGVVDRGGRFNLSIVGAKDGMLEMIASWVQKNHSFSPELSRLRNLRILSLDNDGVVENIYENETLWAGLENTELGSAYVASKSLKRLRPGKKAWFEFGIASEPYMFITTQYDDPKGTILGKQSATLRKQHKAKSIRGIIENQTVSGRYSLTSEQNWMDWEQALLSFIHRNTDLHSLLSSTLIQMAAGDVGGVRPIHPLLREEEPHRLERTAALLESMKADETLYYWFGVGRLVVEDTKAELRESTKELREIVDGDYGKMSLSQNGYVSFQTTCDYNDFLFSLSRWVKKHYREHPAVLNVRNARFGQFSASGKLILKHKDATLWR